MLAKTKANSPNSRQQPTTRKFIEGVLLLDKPLGYSSNAALQKVKKLFCAVKAGHTGTLDPLASGLLPLCFGEATKFSADLLHADKSYEAGICLGTCTDTGDKEGRVTLKKPVEVDLEKIEAVLKTFVGVIQQVPPMYSALKHQGRPLYKLIRQGIEVERPAREVTIHELKLLGYNSNTQQSEQIMHVHVRCSKGTYIRTLAEDIGEALGCGAHLASLRRTAVETLSVDQAVCIEELEALPESELEKKLMPTDYLLKNLPELHLDYQDWQFFQRGHDILVKSISPGRYRVYTNQVFIGIGDVCESGSLHSKRRISDDGLKRLSL